MGQRICGKESKEKAFLGVLGRIKFIYAFLRFVVKFSLIVWWVRVFGPLALHSIYPSHLLPKMSLSFGWPHTFLILASAYMWSICLLAT